MEEGILSLCVLFRTASLWPSWSLPVPPAGYHMLPLPCSPWLVQSLWREVGHIYLLASLFTTAHLPPSHTPLLIPQVLLFPLETQVLMCSSG